MSEDSSNISLRILSYAISACSMIPKYGITMLPKRYFAKVLGMKNGTLNGLHLSQVGHEAMAAHIASVIGNE
jgi:lysophospholipase L1-like esterase